MINFTLQLPMSNGCGLTHAITGQGQGLGPVPGPGPGSGPGLGEHETTTSRTVKAIEVKHQQSIQDATLSQRGARGGEVQRWGHRLG